MGGVAASASAISASIMTVPPSPLPRLFPSSGFPPRLIVQDQHHLPDLTLGEKILPPGHRGVPRRALARQPRPALGDAPEDEALGELRDGAVVLEVRGQRVEARREVAEAVEVIAVTRQAIVIVEALACAAIERHPSGSLAQRAVEPGGRRALPPERDHRA